MALLASKVCALKRHSWHGSTTRTGTSPLKAEINSLKTKVGLGFEENVEGGLQGSRECRVRHLLAKLTECPKLSKPQLIPKPKSLKPGPDTLPHLYLHFSWHYLYGQHNN